MAHALRSGVPPKLGAVLPYLRGASPDVVWPLLKQQSLEGASVDTWPESMAAAALHPSYEPHPLDFDWPFTPETARELADLAILSGDSIALFGMPSVHTAIVESGRESTLVDWNPLVTSRYPRSAHRFDLCRDKIPWRTRFDVVLLDAPWYPEMLLAWLERAFFITKDCGTVAFSLWGELTRPEALYEREEILDLLSLRGHITIHRDALSYASPLFERIAFDAAGVPAPSAWRRGDLVLVRKYISALPPPAPELQEMARWHRFVFGRRQVAVRGARRREESALAPIRDPWRLASVSRRHAPRKSVNVWLSNNQVASLATTEPLLERLYALADGTVSSSRVGDLPLMQQLLEVPLSSGSTPAPWRHQEWLTRS